MSKWGVSSQFDQEVSDVDVWKETKKFKKLLENANDMKQISSYLIVRGDFFATHYTPFLKAINNKEENIIYLLLDALMINFFNKNNEEGRKNLSILIDAAVNLELENILKILNDWCQCNETCIADIHCNHKKILCDFKEASSNKKLNSSLLSIIETKSDPQQLLADIQLHLTEQRNRSPFFEFYQDILKAAEQTKIKEIIPELVRNLLGKFLINTAKLEEIINFVIKENLQETLKCILPYPGIDNIILDLLEKNPQPLLKMLCIPDIKKILKENSLNQTLKKIKELKSSVNDSIEHTTLDYRKINEGIFTLDKKQLKTTILTYFESNELEILRYIFTLCGKESLVLLVAMENEKEDVLQKLLNMTMKKTFMERLFLPGVQEILTTHPNLFLIPAIKEAFSTHADYIKRTSLRASEQFVGIMIQAISVDSTFLRIKEVAELLIKHPSCLHLIKSEIAKEYDTSLNKSDMFVEVENRDYLPGFNCLTIEKNESNPFDEIVLEQEISKNESSIEGSFKSKRLSDKR